MLIPEALETVAAIDDVLDTRCSVEYTDNRLAQDWARISKALEEAGEAVSAFIGATGQNARKGYYASMSEVLNELADLALTGVYAIQHFTKDERRTRDLLLDRLARHAMRLGV